MNELLKTLLDNKVDMNITYDRYDGDVIKVRFVKSLWPYIPSDACLEFKITSELIEKSDVDLGWVLSNRLNEFLDKINRE